MPIFAIFLLPRNPDGLVYHFPLNEKVNADALLRNSFSAALIRVCP
jgi:hypothetical protein